MHDPGHSGRPSGGGGGTVVVVVVGAGGRGLSFWGAALVLSQQRYPCLHVDVCDMSTDGRSQNGVIRLSRQKPGHLGSGGPVVVMAVGRDGGCLGGVGGGGDCDGADCWPCPPSVGAVTQQLLSSPGQYASASTSSQNSANSPLTHSPRHCLLPAGAGGTVAVAAEATAVVTEVVVDGGGGGGGRCGALLTLIRVEFRSKTTKCSSPANASLDTQHRSPVLHISVTFSTASQ